MARIVFLQRLAEEWLGVMYISAMLKSHGHQCNVYVEPLERGDILERALSEPADIVAFSCLTSDHHWALKRAEIVKARSDALIVFGGTHVTLNPRETIQNPNVDVICQGEGEYPVLELADAVDNGEDFSRIRNLWIKKAGAIVRNEIRDLIQDLDSLPFPDRELYAKYPFFKTRGKRPLHLSRGCPYECSYCHNVRKKALFRGKGNYLRWRSIESVLAEIDEIRQKNFVTVLHFIDDSFGLNHAWLKEFMSRLSEGSRERLSIQANMRADRVTKDLCETLQDYGAKLMRLRIAVECGDERYRYEILKKKLSNKDLIQAADLFHKHNIEFTTYNMVGLPGETLDQALETLKLNLRLRPAVAICFVYQPYPGTELSDYALRNGFLTPQILRRMGTPEYQGFYHSTSPLIQKDIEKVENLQKIFGVMARHPSFFPLVNPIVSLRSLSPLLRFVYMIHIRRIFFQRRLRDKY